MIAPHRSAVKKRSERAAFASHLQGKDAAMSAFLPTVLAIFVSAHSGAAAPAAYWTFDEGKGEIAASAVSGAPLRLVTTLKKNHWVAASLCPDGPCPARVRLRVDLPRLGLRSKGYRILLLARGMELLKEPCKRGDSMSRGDLQVWWSAADLAKGVRITILPDNDQYKLLPDRIECPGLKEADRARLEKAVRYMWNRAKAHRSYEHEIVVIAPFDELTIAGEKAE